MKKILFALCILFPLIAKDLPLNDPILRDIDGIPGIFDKHKVKNTVWLMQQISSVHKGCIKLDGQNKPDPMNGNTVQLTFKGKKQTLDSLIVLENDTSLSASDKAELNKLFKQYKDYFGVVNNILIADARGAKELMVKLITEYCRKFNRPHSELLKWEKNVSEAQMYERNITSFTIFKEFSIDLLNFLGALIESCPKAFASFKAAYVRK